MKKNYIKQHRHDAEFEARIGKVIKEFSNEQESISIEEIESWVEMDNMKRRSKRKRVMSVAACFLLICGVSLSMRYYVYTDDPIAVAGGGHGKVTTGENGGGSEYIRTDWDEAMKLAEEYPDMLIPEYIPEGYEFKELKVTKISAGNSYEFMYSNSEAKMIIVKERYAMGDSLITDYDEKLLGQNGAIYLNNDGKSITGVSMLKNTTVTIICQEINQELIKIMDQLKSGS